MRSALRAALLAVPNLPAVAWEGVTYTPVAGTPYLREALRVTSYRRKALGQGGTMQHDFRANLTLVYPSNRGTKDIEAMEGVLIQAFAPGTSLVYGGQSSFVMSAEPYGGLQVNNGWIQSVIVVSFTAYTAT
jgi:hypothetical protein